MYCLCLFSCYNGRAIAVAVEIVWPAKTKTFTICPFMGKVCQPLTYILKAVQPTDYLELKATVQINLILIFFLLVSQSSQLGYLLIRLFTNGSSHPTSKQHLEAFRKHQKHLKVVFLFVTSYFFDLQSTAQYLESQFPSVVVVSIFWDVFSLIDGLKGKLDIMMMILCTIFC